MANVANRSKQIYYPLLELFVSRQMDRKMMQGLVSFKILSRIYVCITWGITNARKFLHAIGGFYILMRVSKANILQHSGRLIKMHSWLGMTSGHIDKC